ncbi:hypothetical protein M0R45_019417 [Rubus argutus]|uniref:Uncharacterized protein n=1 Tax=Rubus argutus TaxID=59490 RepID=A0AAW1X7A0_RUBAR
MATVHGQTARAARHRGLWLISGVARDEVHGQSTWAVSDGDWKSGLGIFSSHVVEARRLGGHGGDAYLHGVDGDELAADRKGGQGVECGMDWRWRWLLVIEHGLDWIDAMMEIGIL